MARTLFENLFPSLCSVLLMNCGQWKHPIKQLGANDIRTLVRQTPDQFVNFNQTLDKILVVRVPGTEAHRHVKEFINETMTELGYTVEEDAFSANTPHGTKPFTNIIATLNPKACKRIILACHYDSKYYPGNKFVGAIDSAVPCSMLIELARALRPSLRLQSQISYQHTIQFVFFDGEEAFESWNEDDSLYGSRHLALKWNRQRFPKTHEDKNRCPGDYASELDRIDVLVLLDLLGTAGPTFYNFFPDTNPLYANLVRAEQQLNNLKLMEPEPPKSSTNYFRNRLNFGIIEDDHKPFLRRNVPVVHIIPSPFPSVWHKFTDNRDALSHRTINNLMKIFKCFIVEYLNLEIIQ
ncbi:glutaminyl-peptide cyclotransferase-like isoform X2 [Brevipalpus obovatus]|uniref:glutaminyl-peptide cyclotransferase-like isoform X2 n=1 Tax=Brevipalpus obovatus TaxID=246614 RepID=UPI003D9F5C58